MSEFSLSAIAACTTATSAVLGNAMLRHFVSSRRRARKDEDAWRDVYDDLAKDQVLSIAITVYPNHGIMRHTYVGKPPREWAITLDEVALMARNVMRFPRSVAISIDRNADV